MDAIGKRVFEYRGRHGITQEKFAKLAGISHYTVTKIENPSGTKLQAVTKGKIEKILAIESLVSLSEI